MSGLFINLFGPSRIELAGIPINVDTRKAIALIAYLAVTRQQHSRDSLATLLWSENDQPHARAALRRTLSSLNKALNRQWLDIERETLGLDFHADIRVDVHDFRSLLAECGAHGHPLGDVCSACTQPLTAAVALYQDDFLAGFSLRDSPGFDEWQFYQADTLRREFASALERLTRCHSTQHHFDTAIAYARRWLALDGLHEPAHRQLMQLYAWAGQRTSALQQYRECVQVLEQELGVSPLEATTHLYQLIKENKIPALPPALQAPIPTHENVGTRWITSAPSRSASPSSATTSTSTSIDHAEGRDQAESHVNGHGDGRTEGHIEGRDESRPYTSTTGYPLVGRADEWATMLKAYQAINGGGRVIVMEGDAGIGKTRLAQELLIHARDRGASVIAARCYEGESQLAYAPIISALRGALAQQDKTQRLDALPASWLSEAMRLLPELATSRIGLPAPLPLDNPGAQTRFYEGIRQLLQALGAGSSPGILFFDDLHWADGASLEWVSYFMRRLYEHPLCLLLTWRGKQPARGTPLYQIFVEAQRAGNATILSLTRLSQPSVRELVQSIGALNRTPNFVDRLYAETEGIPFFLTEYLAAIEKGVLNTSQPDWSLTGGIRDLLSSRLSAVDEIGWQLLNTAAVIGRSFDFDILREASGRSEVETVTALEGLSAQGLVIEVQGHADSHSLTYDFSHEKLRTLVYEETSLARRRLLHRRIAETLASHTHGHRESGSLAGQIAHHYRLAGNDAAAAEYFKLAGEYARSLYANAEAITHLQLALALGHPDTAALHEAIGDLNTLLGEYNNALNSYERAAALGTPDTLSKIEHKLGNVYMRRGEWELAESHLEAALHISETTNQPGQQASIYADWSLAAHQRGQAQQALTLAQHAQELAEANDDTHALAQAHNMLGMLASHQGDTQTALHHLAQSLTLSEKLHDPAMQAAALNNLAQAYKASGDTEHALTLTQSALALCVSQGDRHREAALHNNIADLLHSSGQTEAAMAHLKQAVSIYAEIGVEAGAVQTEIWKLSEW
jgi:predicted ATPase/DNA-binding SARP family transcriptional activator